MNKLKIFPLLPLFLLFMFIFNFRQASAQSELTDSLIKERITHIESLLKEGKPGADLWWKGWLYGYSAATLGQGVIYLANDNVKNRQDMALGAATTFIGAAGQLFTPMTPAIASVKIGLLPGDTPEQRVAKLKIAEELFEASAMREIQGRSWKMHAASGVVNLSSGLVTWLGFKRSLWAGIGNFALNTAVTEAQIWSQPKRAASDYRKYIENRDNSLPESSRRAEIYWVVNSGPGGLSFRLFF